MKKITFCRMLLFASMMYSSSLFADGSKDLYPAGVTGVRAYLRSSLTPTVNWPFPNEGVHYVYAKAGERITMASSAQNTGGSSKIRLIAPNGNTVIDNAIAGQIQNRSAEKAGPQMSGAASGGRYIPIYYDVLAGKTGIYRVEFLARGNGDPGTTYDADFAWTQANQVNDAGILAWDVSVINLAKMEFIPGRVYSNLLNLTNGTGSANTKEFHGKFYTRTKDGYTYRVNNNGNNGLYFTFFVNNNGFIDAATQDPVYKSLNNSTTSFLNGKVHDPGTADTSKNITHKMFYTLPSKDLPVSSIGAVPGNSTWLRNAIKTPVVKDVSVVGVEGTNGQVSNKGGYIKFNADVQGNYTIAIAATPANPSFVTRVLSGSSVAGGNEIFWDGKDGTLPAGVSSPVGTFPVNITIRLQQGEVHFPYIDMEYNRFGTIVELLDHNKLDLPTPVMAVVSDIVYWNDEDIETTTNGSNSNPKNNSHLPLTNSTGISSNTNGHIWGVDGTGTQNLFGDEKAIDTWTFIAAEETTITAEVNVRIADLMVSSITPDRTNAVEGEQIAYTIKVKNGGPSDVVGAPFFFKLPVGLDPQAIQFKGNTCGAENSVLTYDAGSKTYKSKLNLPSGCEITYIVTVTVTNLSSAGNQQVDAAILRTNDVTDPDATNPDVNVPPTDPYVECSTNIPSGTCNNIKTNNAVIVRFACYDDPNTTNPGVPSKQGITLLQRAGVNNGNWPMIRNSAHTVLESNIKGFVITRMTSDPAQPGALNNITKITNPIDGMMVYDTFAKCLKIYDGMSWKCFSTPACP